MKLKVAIILLGMLIAQFLLIEARAPGYGRHTHRLGELFGRKMKKRAFDRMDYGGVFNFGAARWDQYETGGWGYTYHLDPHHHWVD